MEVYFIFMIILFMISYIASKMSNKKDYDRVSFLVFIMLFVFSAFRYKIGADYEYTYLPGYEIIKRGKSIYFEPLFLLLNKFVYMFFNNVDWVFIISSFITVFLIYCFIKKDSENFFISVVMLFATRCYFYSFSQVRQYIAIAIFLISIKYIVEKKWKIYFFNIFIASLFHKTAILYFPIYFINRIKLNKKVYIFLFLFSFGLKPFFNQIYNILGNNLYGSYISSQFGVGNYSIVMTATAFVFTFISILFYDRLIKNPKNITYVNLQIFLWILVITISNINESYRIIAMFMYSSIILISKCYKLCGKKEKIALSTLILCIAFYATYLMLIYNDGKSMIPYRTIFNKD